MVGRGDVIVEWDGGEITGSSFPGICTHQKGILALSKSTVKLWRYEIKQDEWILAFTKVNRAQLELGL